MRFKKEHIEFIGKALETNCKKGCDKCKSLDVSSPEEDSEFQRIEAISKSIVRCEYLDCGWCYATYEVENNSSDAGHCNDYKNCPHVINKTDKS